MQFRPRLTRRGGRCIIVSGLRGAVFHVKHPDTFSRRLHSSTEIR